MNETSKTVFFSSAKGISSVVTNNQAYYNLLRNWAESGEIKHEDQKAFLSQKDARKDQQVRFLKP